MTKIYVQEFPIIWQSSASLAASGSTSSSAHSGGYARLLGMVIASGSTKAGSGLRVLQSPDGGTNWDYYADFEVSACSASAFSLEVIGNAVKIEWRNGADDADVARMLWQLRPI